MIADKLHARGWSWGMVQAIQEGAPIWIVDAERGGERHIVRAEEITVAFLELERSTENRSLYENLD